MVTPLFYKVHAGDFLVEPKMLNHLEILHGGELFRRCDSAIGLLASQYSHSKVMTVSVKKFNFKQRAYLGQQIYFCISLLQTSNHTMTFYVSVEAKHLEEESGTQIGEGMLTFVAVDASFDVLSVPHFVPTDIDQKEFIKSVNQSVA